MIKALRSIIMLLLVLSSCVNKQAPKSRDTTNVAMRDTSLTFFSRDTGFYINQEYIEIMPDVQKAAAGYVATFIGCDCWWDGDEMAEDMSNLDCKIISALGLGYQCSDTHLGFLRQWFAKDEAALEDLKDSNCPKMPYTATVQNTFDDIQLRVSNDTIIIYYEVSGINMRTETTWRGSETVYFAVHANNISIIDKVRSDIIRERFGDATE